MARKTKSADRLLGEAVQSVTRAQRGLDEAREEAFHDGYRAALVKMEQAVYSGDDLLKWLRRSLDVHLPPTEEDVADARR